MGNTYHKRMGGAALLCTQLAFATDGTDITHPHKTLEAVRVAVCAASDEQSGLQRTKLRSTEGDRGHI